VEFASPRHDPGGYWFEVCRHFSGPTDWSDPEREYTMRDHIADVKREGWPPLR
jgi:hypothetical protein